MGKFCNFSEEDNYFKKPSVAPELRIFRPALNQHQLQERFQWDPPPSRNVVQRRIAQVKRSKLFGCCSWHLIRDSVFGFFPILQWLPEYRWKEDFLDDFVAGFTVAVMNIPQGKIKSCYKNTTNQLLKLKIVLSSLLCFRHGLCNLGFIPSNNWNLYGCVSSPHLYHDGYFQACFFR